MKSFMKSWFVAALFAVAASLPANARPVLVTADLNVRLGPGTEHPSVGVIPGGSTADVGRCDFGWCEIFWRGVQGFSSAAYLDGGGPRVYAPPPPPVIYGPPPYYGPGPYWGPRRPWRYW